MWDLGLSHWVGLQLSVLHRHVQDRAQDDLAPERIEDVDSGDRDHHLPA